MLSMVIDSISSFMYSKLLVIMLIGTGVYFTIRTKFPQVRLFRSACKAVMEKPDDEDAVSSFQALMVSTASRVGTGNIVGVSSAICIGGFGAVFWMWVIAIIGSASAFVESTLAQIYKKKGGRNMLRRTGVLHRGCTSVQTAGNCILYCHDRDICIWI